jgi:hypothetical protein
MKPSASRLPKDTNKQAATHQTAPPAITDPAPPPMGVIGLTVLSTAEAWDSSRCITEFPEGLRSREAYREGIHVSLCYFNPLIPFTNSRLF